MPSSVTKMPSSVKKMPSSVRKMWLSKKHRKKLINSKSWLRKSWKKNMKLQRNKFVNTKIRKLPYLMKTKKATALFSERKMKSSENARYQSVDLNSTCSQFSRMETSFEAGLIIKDNWTDQQGVSV